MARHTGYAPLPLHTGRAPAWLFTRMTRLAREIAIHVVADQGPEQLLRRLSDPFGFRRFHRAMSRAKVDGTEKVEALKRLAPFARRAEPPVSR